jgi:hypothetical protein
VRDDALWVICERAYETVTARQSIIFKEGTKKNRYVGTVFFEEL